MSSRSLRGSRQRKALQLDLNLMPPLEETTVQNAVDPNEDDDDDVVELSPTTFAQVQTLLLRLSLIFSGKTKKSVLMTQELKPLFKF